MRCIQTLDIFNIHENFERRKTGVVAITQINQASMAQLPEVFYSEQKPTKVSEPELVYLNHDLLAEFSASPSIRSEKDSKLDATSAKEILSGNQVPSDLETIATAYSGHQFGGWSPELGDGRAVLLGELETVQGVAFELQLKGSGPTAYSRGGDGRATLSAMLREYLISEAMAALSIPTSRSLAIFKTGEEVFRETNEEGAVLSRLMRSHIRVGSFQYAAATSDVGNVKALAEFTLQRLYPELANSDAPYIDMFKAIAARQAELIAQWMHVGFIHGVMNTDNMAVSGETFDYGPCAFMDSFDPRKVFSSIDHFGRYAWNNQPNIGMWNLNRLAESLLAITGPDDDTVIDEFANILKGFLSSFEDHLHSGFSNKLGLPKDVLSNRPFILKTLALMRDQNVDFTLFFRRLTQIAEGRSDINFAGLFTDPSSANEWLKEWEGIATSRDAGNNTQWAVMSRTNPIFIPRNHQVELALTNASQASDFSVFDNLLNVLSRPFEENEEHIELEAPPTSEQEVRETFCGT